MYPFTDTTERMMIQGVLADLVLMLAALASLSSLVSDACRRIRQERAVLAAREKWALALLVPALLTGLAIFEFFVTRIVHMHA